MSNTFQDRLAQYLLAVLYTSNHIDITLSLRNVETLKKEARDKAIAGKDGKPLSRRETDNANAAGNAAHISSFEQGKVPYSAWVAQHQSQNPVIGPVFHQRVEDQEPEIVSEIEQDTVAVVIQGNTVYVACNYKVRRSPTRNLTRMDYQAGSFDTMSQHSLTLIKGAVLTEIRTPAPLGAPTLPGEELADGIRYICVIGLKDTPDNERTSAAPHAEMQLLNYLDTTGRNSSGLYWGVSKECCSRCADILKARNASFGARHSRNVTNWLQPAQIDTVLKDVLVIG